MTFSDDDKHRPVYSTDWLDVDVRDYVALCKRVEIYPLDLLRCMFNESDARANAHNPHGDACGLIQFMPATRRGLGFPGTWEAFAALGVSGQLPYVERYFKPYLGHMGSIARIYCAMFLPACLSWNNLTDTTVLTSMHGPLAWAYLPNKGLDLDDKGYITLGDLGRAANRAATGKRWIELSARVIAEMQNRTTDPELDTGPTSEDFPANDAGTHTNRDPDDAA